MCHYHHLSIKERECIMLFAGLGLSIRQIARSINRNCSTVSRELKRNLCYSNRYFPSSAQYKYQQRRKKCRRTRILETQSELKELVMHLIRDEQWSPEQVCGRLMSERGVKISYNTIYRAIWHRDLDPARWSKKKHHAKGFERYLRRKGRRRKSKNEAETRGYFVISHDISERPPAADARSEIGHVEADTVWGHMKSGCVLTLVDRKTRYLFAKLLKTRKSSEVNDAILSIVQEQAGRIKTITPDRGKEFAQHFEVTEETGIEFYFPQAGQPWKRGTNENTNGLLREYMPKRKLFTDYKKEDLCVFVDKINKRPRKILNWLSAYEVFNDLLLHFT